jgi:SAM-dependent methyltransferase
MKTPPLSREVLFENATAYSFANDSREYSRLVAQAAWFCPDTEELLREIHLKPGSSAVDFGCGPIGILDLLAKKVGPHGCVVGIDRDDVSLAMARGHLPSGLRDRVKLVVGDASRTGLPDQHFELSHVRLVLVHLPVSRAREVLAEMLRVTKHGGFLAVHEIDWGPWGTIPESPWFVLAKKLVSHIWEDAGRDPLIGARVGAWLGDLGLEKITLKHRRELWSQTHPKHGFMKELLCHLKNDGLESGRWTEREFEELYRGVGGHLATPGVLVSSPEYVLAHGRKP